MLTMVDEGKNINEVGEETPEEELSNGEVEESDSKGLESEVGEETDTELNGENRLPNTAGNSFNLLLFGLLIVIIGGSLTY